ncbi:MAG: flavin reductase family protein [Pseudonocardiaceae bacterium]
MANRSAVPVAVPEGFSPSPSPRVREASLRDVMKSFATGVTVLTAGGEHSHGMTANAINSVSLDPPLVLCCVARNAGMHRAITVVKSFGLSILAADQEDLARYFADRRRPGGPAQFAGLDWWPGRHTSAPLLAGCLGWLECELGQVYDGGDHSIFLGKVRDATRSAQPHGLLFFGGQFHQVCRTRGSVPDESLGYESLGCCW